MTKENTILDTRIVNHEIAKEITKEGAFNRQTNRFTTPFGDGPGELPVEAGRYRLLWARICP
jgi:putative glutathione S-transferase